MVGLSVSESLRMRRPRWANFLQKPLSLNAMPCFSTAVNFVIRERRRYFRHPVEMPAAVVFGGGHRLKVTVPNISEGGMAIVFCAELPPGPCPQVVFNLPEIAFLGTEGAGRLDE